MATTLYCAESDLQNRLSATGTTLRVDDATGTPAQTALANEVIKNASTKIDFYCLGLYTADVLATNDWIKERCIDLAVYLLCLRRNNSASKGLKEQYDEAIMDLKLVRSGDAKLPGAPQKKGLAPVLSQPRAKLYPVPETVIERGRSTGQPAGYPRRDDPFEPPIAGNY